MRRFISVVSIILFSIICSAQIIVNPVFDRTDTPAFRVEKVELTSDTTYVHCTYCAEEKSWASISEGTYLEDVISGSKYPIIKSFGIPFSPQKRNFEDSTTIQVLLYFPGISSKKINIIENEDNESFNIYGINLMKSYDSVYSDNDFINFYDLSQKCDSLDDVDGAIKYKFKQIDAANYLCGLRSIYSGSIAYDLCLLYNKYNQLTPSIDYIKKALYWGEYSLSILSNIPDSCGVSKDDIARIQNTLSSCCFSLGDYQKALKYGELSLETRKELFGTDNLLYAKSLWNLSNVYRVTNNMQMALDCMSQVCNIYLEKFGRYNPNTYNATYQLINTYIKANNIESAIETAKGLIPICDSLYTKKSNEYLELLSKLVLCYYYYNSFEKAINYAEEAYNLVTENDDIIEPEMAVSCIVNLLRLYNYTSQYEKAISVGENFLFLSNRDYDIANSLSEAYEKVNKINNAIQCRENALSLCKNNSDNFLYSMDKLGVLYIDKGDYLKAMDVYYKLSCIYDSVTIQDSVTYANVLSHVSVIYSLFDNYKEADIYAKKSKQIRYNLLNSNADDKLTLYGNYLLSIVNVVSGMITDSNDEALKYIDEGIDFINSNKEWLDSINSNKLYASLICFKGNYFNNRGLFREALDFFDQALNLQIDSDSLGYIETLIQISKTYMRMGDDETAMQIVMKAKSAADSFVGVPRSLYIDVLNELAVLNYRFGNYPQSIDYFRDLVEISEKAYGHYSLQYATKINNIASSYHIIGEKNKERQYKKEALHILEHIGQNYGILYSSLCRDIAPYNIDSTLIYLEKAKKGLVLCGSDKSSTMVKILQYEADYYLINKDTLKAIDCIHNAINIIKEYGGENTPEYADMCTELSRIYVKNDIPLSLQYAEKSFRLYKKLYNKSSYAYAEVLFGYGKMLFIANKSDSILNYLKESSDIMMSHFQNAAITMPHKETITYWNSVLGNRFRQWIPLICKSYNNNQSNQLLYDVLLFMKGLILSIDRGTRQSILTSKDSSLVYLYKRYSEISASINIQFSLPSSKRVVNIDSLLLLKENIGWSLSKSLTNKGYRMNQKYTWEDVKKRLKGDELAVEFGNYYDKEGELCYYALVINNNSSSPKFVELFDQTVFDSFVKEEKVDSLKLSNLIWKPILENYSNVNKLYFSPFGILNLYGIEYLPINNKQSSDSIMFYRLSSTKELCDLKDFRESNNAVLYGGIDYNHKESNDEEYGEFDCLDDYKDITRSISMRGDFEPLYNSEKEIDSISSFLLSKGIECEMYKKNRATEKSLKMLSGKSTRFLHFATHGMYIDIYEVDEKKKNNNMRFVISDDNADNEEKALSRSFLVMSGGNILMHREESTSYAEDDGILTALEISNLNLKDLDLVVLSACQSALGDVMPEGVYGLQRGFKKAGANTILMSLNKVDDEATRVLMVEFYKNLMSGKTKHQSLKDAQKYLRHVENGKYDKPEYWASFIMLDGLN